MWRSWLRALFLAGGLAAGGCTDEGSYELKWVFAGDDEPVSAGCGAHGVDSIRVTGTSTEGDGESVTALCTDGQLAHTVAVGTWTFAVHQLDVRGTPIVVYQLDADGQPVLDANNNPVPVPDPTATAAIAEDATVPVDPAPVVLTPRPECSDGIDNDRDGRVDLDDLDCMTPSTAAE
jgi:hypothetical protein